VALSADRSAVVGLAATVGEVAGGGDGVAAKLVDGCAKDLADHVTALLHHFTSADPVAVVLGGKGYQRPVG